MAYERGPATRAPVPKMGGSASLAELLNVILDKGIVVDAWVRLSVIGIEILTLEARIVVASVETYLRYAEAVGLTELASPPPNHGTQQNGHSRNNDRRELSQDDVMGYLKDHPQGIRLGELQAYFDAPRDQVQTVLNRLVDEHKAQRDDEQKLYYPSNG